MTTVLYARVSTSEQTIAHQRTQAEAMGFKFDEVVCDEGVSGVATKLRERAEGRRLFDLLRNKGDVLVVRWIDRLGRNYEDVTETLRHFMQKGIVVRTVIGGMTFDGSTTDPMQKAIRDALIAFMAAQSQAQAQATKEAQVAGIAHAKENRPDAYLGRKPSFTEAQVSEVLGLLGEGRGVSEMAKLTGLSRQTIYRIKKSPEEAFACAQAWG